MYIKYMAVIVLAITAILILASTKILEENKTYAAADKLDFVMTVNNIAHDNVTVTLTVDGMSQNITLGGNPDYVVAPTSQKVKFTIPRNGTGVGTTSLKVGDEYIPCLALKTSESTCLSAKIDSLTISQAKTLDVKNIPIPQ
jgi:hypothetical protein